MLRERSASSISKCSVPLRQPLLKYWRHLERAFVRFSLRTSLRSNYTIMSQHVLEINAHLYINITIWHSSISKKLFPKLPTLCLSYIHDRIAACSSPAAKRFFSISESYKCQQIHRKLAKSILSISPAPFQEPELSKFSSIHPGRIRYTANLVGN